MSLLVSSCATYNVGESPLTEEEIANFQNANPNAYTINYINDLEFDVTNTTYTEPNSGRWIQIHKNYAKYPIYTQQEKVAEKHCITKDSVSYQLGEINKFSRRYKCVAYIDASLNWMESNISYCSNSKNSDKTFLVHPCDNVKGNQKYCKTFTDRFDIQQGQYVPCQELKQKRDKASYTQNVDTKTDYQTPKVIEKSFDFAEAEKKCIELGFKAKSEKFADCVIKITR
jgi:hypothetical protein